MWAKIDKSENESVCFRVIAVKKDFRKVILLSARKNISGIILCESKQEASDLMEKIIYEYTDTSRIYEKIEGHAISLNNKEGLC